MIHMPLQWCGRGVEAVFAVPPPRCFHTAPTQPASTQPPRSPHSTTALQPRGPTPPQLTQQQHSNRPLHAASAPPLQAASTPLPGPKPPTCSSHAGTAASALVRAVFAPLYGRLNAGSGEVVALAEKKKGGVGGVGIKRGGSCRKEELEFEKYVHPHYLQVPKTKLGQASQEAPYCSMRGDRARGSISGRAAEVPIFVPEIRGLGDRWTRSSLNEFNIEFKIFIY